MTFRAVIIGILSAILFGVWGMYANKYIPGVKGLVRGQLPVSIFGMLILYMLFVAPFMSRVRRSWKLRGSEVALIFAMTLVSCSVIDAGLMRHFPRVLIQPFHQLRLHPAWQQQQIIDDAPKIMLTNNGQPDDKLLNMYLTAMVPEGQWLPWSQVPWHAWLPPLLFWGAIILLAAIAVIALALVLHRQWADRERIRYPIAELAGSLLEEAPDGRPAILRNRPFWVGLGIVLAIRVINGLDIWFPGGFSIPLTLDFSAIALKFPEFMRTPGAENIRTITLHPAVIGLTFLLATDIGFSLGIANFVGVAALYLMLKMGVSTAGSAFTGGVLQWYSFGTFAAMAVMIVYFGRRYYADTLIQAVTGRRREGTYADSVWATRIGLVCVAAVIGLLAWAGLDWTLAVTAVLLVAVTFMIYARLTAECGIFFYHTPWCLPGVIAGVLGLTTLGPVAMVALGLFTYVLAFDTNECLLPYAMNGLKVATRMGLKPGKVALVLAVGMVLLLAVAIPTAVWADHKNAAEMLRGSDTSEIFDAAVRSKVELKMSGQLETVAKYGPLERLAHAHPQPGCLQAIAVGFVLLVACSVLRQRCTWWPIHPVLLLVFCTSANKFCSSFFLGWLAKAAVVSLGGAAQYRHARPFMIGVIVGDLGGGFLIMLTNMIYFACTGQATYNYGLLW